MLMMMVDDGDDDDDDADDNDDDKIIVNDKVLVENLTKEERWDIMNFLHAFQSTWWSRSGFNKTWENGK